VRDSKNRSGGTLFFTNTEWQAFLDGARAGQFSVRGKVDPRLPR
jgi:hypothetical protein